MSYSQILPSKNEQPPVLSINGGLDALCDIVFGDQFFALSHGAKVLNVSSFNTLQIAFYIFTYSHIYLSRFTHHA